MDQKEAEANGGGDMGGNDDGGLVTEVMAVVTEAPPAEPEGEPEQQGKTYDKRHGYYISNTNL